MLMVYLIAAIGLMSIFDLHCTLKWIGLNPYMEANPIMRCLWLVDPVLFVIIKIIVTLIFCLTAYRFKNNRLLRRLIWLPFYAYAFVVFIPYFLRQFFKAP
jgi:nitrogen fixation/metabolism regulation signal transduction histidine kinase